MPSSSSKPDCIINEKIHEIDTRMTVVETKMGYVEEAIKENKHSLDKIEESVNGIESHISKQNGMLPRIEDSLSMVITRLNETEKTGAIVTTRQKLIWASVSAIVTGVAFLIIKLLTGV